MRKSMSGFTIVELIIIVVVIGILATITVVAYNSVRTNALNTARISELKDWQKSFEQYKASNGAYPSMANGGYCLGTGFPDQKCRNYNAATNFYTEANSTALMDALKTYDPPGIGTREPVNNTSLGPYVEYSSTIINLLTNIKGAQTDCPDGTVFSWWDGVDRVICKITLTK